MWTKRSISGSLLVTAVLLVAAAAIEPVPKWGLPIGLIAECPGLENNVTISESSMRYLQVIMQKPDTPGKAIRLTVPITAAPKAIARAKFLDFKNHKTVVYVSGFIDSSFFPHSLAISNEYAVRGYNVIMPEHFKFMTRVYPVSYRFGRVIGRKLGELLVTLRDQGLRAEDLSIVGQSLGAHIGSFAAKYYFQATGEKPARLTGLDPAGPCVRFLSPEHRLYRTDAHFVDVLHTNIDGFGMAEPIGHVDFYANGGEYQPNDIPFIPCESICSHFKSMFFWYQALKHPKKFIAIECDSVQQARVFQCFNNTQTNYLGLETKFDRPGLYYLPTDNVFPYYRGKVGLKAKNEIYSKRIGRINAEHLVI